MSWWFVRRLGINGTMDIPALTWALLAFGSVHARLPQRGAAGEEEIWDIFQRKSISSDCIFGIYIEEFIPVQKTKQTRDEQWVPSHKQFLSIDVKAGKRFVPHLSELLSRDWQLPETEFSALLQGSSPCRGAQWKNEGCVCACSSEKNHPSLKFIFGNFGSIHPKCPFILEYLSLAFVCTDKLFWRLNERFCSTFYSCTS